jgi:hypothetical protein
MRRSTGAARRSTRHGAIDGRAPERGAHAARLGSLEPARWLYDDSTSWPVDPTVSSHPIGGYHHMGTTR